MAYQAEMVLMEHQGETVGMVFQEKMVAQGKMEKMAKMVRSYEYGWSIRIVVKPLGLRNPSLHSMFDTRI